MRLVGALRDVMLDYGEGVRDMRVCLEKAKLYEKLFVKNIEPWSIIPYVYKPEGDLEKLLDNLYYSMSYEELSAKIVDLNLKDLMRRSFREHLKAITKIADDIALYHQFAGKHVGNYIALYLLVEDNVRSRVWSMLPGRWKLEEEFKGVDHEFSHITCGEGEVMWMISRGRGEEMKIERYGVSES